MQERRSFQSDALTCARRCFEAAEKATDKATRDALQRAGDRYLQKFHGPGFIGRTPAAQPQPVDVGAGARRLFASRLFQ